MGDALVGCSSVWDLMVDKAVISVITMSLSGLLVMVSGTLARELEDK